uniref:TFIIS N-terminal domain-containing protein n=1 Tax=Rhabditophanes sp. KR3021 TaxID=114890 RepID=A0AC35U7R9_9BILA
MISLLKATRVGQTVNSSRRDLADKAPALSKRLRKLIKKWQSLKFDDEIRPVSCGSISKSGVASNGKGKEDKNNELNNVDVDTNSQDSTSFRKRKRASDVSSGSVKSNGLISELRNANDIKRLKLDRCISSISRSSSSSTVSSPGTSILEARRKNALPTSNLVSKLESKTIDISEESNASYGSAKSSIVTSPESIDSDVSVRRVLSSRIIVPLQDSNSYSSSNVSAPKSVFIPARRNNIKPIKKSIQVMRVPEIETVHDPRKAKYLVNGKVDWCKNIPTIDELRNRIKAKEEAVKMNPPSKNFFVTHYGIRIPIMPYTDLGDQKVPDSKFVMPSIPASKGA